MTIYMIQCMDLSSDHFHAFKIIQIDQCLLSKVRKLHAYLSKSFYKCPVLSFRAHAQCDIVV